MKKLVSISSSLLLATVFTLVSCQSSSEKVKNAEAEVEEADKNLNNAQEEYMADMEHYKMENHARITENEQYIIDFKSRMALRKSEAKDEYNEKIKALESQNTDMKRKLDEYQLEGKAQWNSFKTEYDHDMEALVKALKDLSVDNK